MFPIEKTNINTIVSAGSSVCRTPTRVSIAWTCLAVLYIAMNGGTMMSHPKIIAISDRVGLIVWSFSKRRISSLIL